MFAIQLFLFSAQPRHQKNYAAATAAVIEQTLTPQKLETKLHKQRKHFLKLQEEVLPGLLFESIRQVEAEIFGIRVSL